MNRLFRGGAVAALTLLGFAGMGSTPMAAASSATSPHGNVTHTGRGTTSTTTTTTTLHVSAGQPSEGTRSATTVADGRDGQVLAKRSRLRHRTTHSRGNGKFAWWMLPLFAIPVGIAGVVLFLFFRSMKRKR